MRLISKSKGYGYYLYRTIDADSYTLDIWLHKQRDNIQHMCLIKRLIKQFGKPKMIIADQAPSMKVPMAIVIQRFKLNLDLLYI